MKVKVTYLEHSGFLLETPKAAFLFDYYKGEIPPLNRELPLVVFVSHKHGDHYNPEIFELVRTYPHIQYIVSRDVPVKWQIQKYREQGISLEEHVFVVLKNTQQEFPLGEGKSFQLETFKSTDEGVAFLLTFEGITIYHAGDLNLWVWEGETSQYNRNMERAYFRELEKLKGRKIDVAFLPLDPRQEGSAFAGMESFIENTKTGCVFPMHMWGSYEIIGEYLEKHPGQQEAVKRISAPGQSFEMEVNA